MYTPSAKAEVGVNWYVPAIWTGKVASNVPSPWKSIAIVPAWFTWTSNVGFVTFVIWSLFDAPSSWPRLVRSLTPD
jgi:hypothetical protein